MRMLLALLNKKEFGQGFLSGSMFSTALSATMFILYSNKFPRTTIKITQMGDD